MEYVSHILEQVESKPLFGLVGTHHVRRPEIAETDTLEDVHLQRRRE